MCWGLGHKDVQKILSLTLEGFPEASRVKLIKFGHCHLHHMVCWGWNGSFQNGINISDSEDPLTDMQCVFSGHTLINFKPVFWTLC